jgi:MinD superfamily P-loop ATPase
MCQYSAIACVGETVLVYPELCRSCGGCTLVCPVDAITEASREIGAVETGWSGQIQFAQGVLNVGAARAVPVIKAVKSTAFNVDLTVIDAPPGTSCPVIEAVRDVAFVVLVAEPTPFGFHDLKLAVEVTGALTIPFGVIINRSGLDGADVRSYCHARQIPILSEIPDDRELAEAYSQGEMACNVLPKYESIFDELLNTIAANVRRGTESR